MVLQFYKTKRFAVFRNFQVISMRFAVFLCHCVRCLYLFLCGFAVFIRPLHPPHWWRRVLSPWQNLWYAKGKNSPQVNPVYFTTERSNDSFCFKCCLRHHWVFYQSMLTCMPHNIGQLSGWEFNVHFYPFPTLGIT